MSTQYKLAEVRAIAEQVKALRARLPEASELGTVAFALQALTGAIESAILAYEEPKPVAESTATTGKVRQALKDSLTSTPPSTPVSSPETTS